MELKRLTLALCLAASSTSAFADGLYLKLSTAKPKVAPAEPVDLAVQAVSTRSLDLAPPEIWVDQGSGFQVRPDLKCEAEGAAKAVTVTPDRATQSTCRVSFAQPGTYRVRLRYRVQNRVHETNKLTLEVASQRAAEPAR